MAIAAPASRIRYDANESVGTSKPQQPLEPPPSESNFFSEILARIHGDHVARTNNSTDQDRKQSQQEIVKNSALGEQHQQLQQQQQIQPVQRRACRAPLTRKFAHPCHCNQSGNHKQSHAISNSSNTLPPAAYTFPLHLWDPMTKKCLPTSRNRDMLLKECRLNVATPYPSPPQLYKGPPCVYEDLICDARRNRCVCKPSLHLYYESNGSTFGCVPIGPTSGPDGRPNCRPGYIYNVISKECQKIFDVNELPPSYTAGVSATQFSFVTIVLIWILLLILILTAKLRKFRSSNIYRNSPTSERRLHRSGSHRYQNQGAPAWLHPFIAAVNGHHHLNQHRSNIDRQSQMVDDQGNYNDTEFFLANGRRVNDALNTNNDIGSQLSLNNPPPKFEEIYPACRGDRTNSLPPPPPPPPPASNEDLPSYDEAMKLRNTIPPDIHPKE